MMIETIELYTLILVWMILTFIEGHSCMTNQSLWCYLLANLSIGLDKIQCVATTCCFVEGHAKIIVHKFLCTSTIQGRELC